MEISKKTTIDKPVDLVWNILVNDFDKAQEWMAAVPKSYKMEEGEQVAGAPMIGRICELSSKSNPPIAVEAITAVDKGSYSFKVNIVPRNGKIPVDHNNLSVTLNPLTENQTEVVWASDITLKTSGKLLYPVLKAGLSKSFTEILEELKHYTETGQPHPRKQAALNK